jgi:hypothetical protein
MADQKIIKALELGLSYAQHQASFQPTTPSRAVKVMQARKDAAAISLALDAARKPDWDELTDHDALAARDREADRIESGR